MVFPIGAPNDGFAQYFVGQSYLALVSTSQVGVFNVTFEPGCRNNWHIHHAKNGGGQIIICVAGRGYYQEEGKETIEMKPGDCINIPAEVKMKELLKEQKICFSDNLTGSDFKSVLQNRKGVI